MGHAHRDICLRARHSRIALSSLNLQFKSQLQFESRSSDIVRVRYRRETLLCELLILRERTAHTSARLLGPCGTNNPTLSAARSQDGGGGRRVRAVGHAAVVYFGLCWQTIAHAGFL